MASTNCSNSAKHVRIRRISCDWSIFYQYNVLSNCFVESQKTNSKKQCCGFREELVLACCGIRIYSQNTQFGLVMLLRIPFKCYLQFGSSVPWQTAQTHSYFSDSPPLYTWCNSSQPHHTVPARPEGTLLLIDTGCLSAIPAHGGMWGWLGSPP